MHPTIGYEELEKNAPSNGVLVGPFPYILIEGKRGPSHVSRGETSHYLQVSVIADL
jgi:hypothetical protein